MARLLDLAAAGADAGGKAHGLARLIAAEVPTPPGFVIAPAVFTELVGAREGVIDRLRRAVAIAAPNREESESIVKREQKLQERIAEFRDEVRGSLGRMSERSRALRRYAER